jgi:Tol biopolymer transport system component
MTDDAARLSAALEGRYRIERELGAGGMAVVYLAQDVKHNRKVALKVLRPELAHAIGPERFLREIETTANLRHPHILPLYDSGQAAEFLFYVMPFVEGESLRDRLDREKQLPVDDALRIAREVADALSYAHSRGVIHRDIKPENILLESGHAVVADFGIARAVDAAGGDRLTETGMSIGTPTYMSPEQAAGERDLDGRSDLYALGCVLYEMLAGQPPFTGPSVESVIHQHLTAAAPPIAQRRPAVPAEVAGVLDRALAKTPADRFNPVAQFSDALSRPMGGMSHAATGTRWPRWLVPTLAIAGLVIVALAFVALRGRGTAGVVGGASRQLTLEPGLEVDPAISPDGEMVAYAAGRFASMQIFVRRISGGRTIQLTDDSTRTHRWPRWSPDGAQIAFQSAGGIYVVPALGGSPRPLLATATDTILGFDWSPDAKRIVVALGWEGSLRIADLAGGETTPLPGTTAAHMPAWSPDGTRVAYVADNQLQIFDAGLFGNEARSSIWVTRVDGGAPVRVSDDEHTNLSPVWMPDGRSLLWVSDRDGTRDILQVRVGASGAPSGEPRRLTTGLGVQEMSVSADGRHLAYSVLQSYSNIWAFDLPRTGTITGDQGRAVTRGSQIVEDVGISPDGRWIAFSSDRGGSENIWRVPVTGGEPVPVTTGPGSNMDPDYSPDGTRIAFHSMRNGNRDLYTIAPDGGNEQPILTRPLEDGDPVWSPDGRSLAFFTFGEDMTNPVTSVMRLDGRKPRALANGMGARWSPDGQEIAYAGPDGVRVIPSDSGPSRLLAPTGSLAVVEWSSDGRFVYFVDRDGSRAYLRAVPRAGGPIRTRIVFDDPERAPAKYGIDVYANTVYLTIGRHETNVWTMELTR